MCELLGASLKRKVQVNGLLRTFFSHAAAHPHGWGLALFPQGTDRALVEKEPVCALDSARLHDLLEFPVVEQSFLAHIRLATVGTVERVNCHPFQCKDATGRNWTLVHNGTIFSCPPLNAYTGAQRGRTDSERVLLHLVETADRTTRRLNRPLTEADLFVVLEEALAMMADGNKLNLLFRCGETLYVHTNMRGTLHLRETPDGFVFATVPLTDGTEWRECPFARLLAYRQGRLVREGHCHGHEYVYNPEDYRKVFLSYSEL